MISAAEFTGTRSDTPLLVLDFDGTVCLGDGPVIAYADAVAAQLPKTVADRMRITLAAFFAGQVAPEAFPDGYSVVAAFAQQQLSRADLSRAYLASRRTLAAGTLDVHAPDGLAELLAELSGTVQRILLTNAPDIDLAAVLERLGLADGLDTVISSAGKPAGFDDLLPALLAGAPASRLMSVGDVWPNDIEPPLRAGCATAHVDVSGVDTRPAHLRATSLPVLYPPIREWADDPADFTARYPIHPHRPALSDLPTS